jgi:hypothetical protein
VGSIGTLCALACAGPSRRSRWTVTIAALDVAGRVEIGRLGDVLGWIRPASLAGRVGNGRLVLKGASSPCEQIGTTISEAAGRRRGVAVKLRLDPRGRLRVPAGVRVRLGLTALGRVLLAADGTAGVLVVSSLSVLDRTLGELVEEGSR